MAHRLDQCAGAESQLRSGVREVVGFVAVRARSVDHDDLREHDDLDHVRRWRHDAELERDSDELTLEPVHTAPVTAVDSRDTSAADVASSVPMQSLRVTTCGLLSVVAPTTLVVALLYYFGWARTSAQAHAMGLDDSLFGYSTQDYILRSISSMFWPLFIGAGVLLAGLVLQAAATSWFDATSDRRRLRQARLLAAGLAVAGCVLLSLGILGERVRHPSRFVSLYAPVAVTLAIVAFAYAAHLFGRYGPHLGNAQFDRETIGLAPLAWSLVVVLLFLSLFWSVSHYAGVRGVDLAVQAEAAIPRQPSVTLYSAKRLYLEPPVVETRLPDANAEYQYRYTGLKLLFRSEHNYFLRPSDPGDPRNIIIAERPDLRFEFSR